MANGVEWFATEKIDVHGKSDLNWGAGDNMVSLISTLNALLSSHPSFAGVTRQRLIQRGDGNFLAVLRGDDVLVLANLDCCNPVHVQWDAALFPEGVCRDLLDRRDCDLRQGFVLGPGGFMCLERKDRDGGSVNESQPEHECRASGCKESKCMVWRWPEDERREVCIPDGMGLRIESPHPYRALILEGDRAFPEVPPYEGDGTRARRLTLEIAVFAPGGVKRSRSALLVLPPPGKACVRLCVSGDEIRRDPTLRTCLSNGAGADAFVPVRWGEIPNRY